MDDKQPPVTALSEPSESSPSESSSPPVPQTPWWKAPEKVIAVAGAIGLRAWNKLGPEETTIVLTVALGSPIASVVTRLFRRLKGRRE